MLITIGLLCILFALWGITKETFTRTSKANKDPDYSYKAEVRSECYLILFGLALVTLGVYLLVSSGPVLS